jgi:hypothetical protein
MRLGVGIFLLAAGGIIAFGIRDTSSQINLTVVGIVIMLAGVVGLWVAYRIATRSGTDDTELLKPGIEDQYRIDPHPVDQQIDVTPSAFRPKSEHFKNG